MQYVIPFENHWVKIPFGTFYGYNSIHYLDIMMEFGECREKLDKLIGNAIVQRNVYQLDEFREMIHMTLGNMGIDSDETAFYEKMVQYVQYIAINCYNYVIGKDVEFLDVLEDAEWMNLFYRETWDPVLCDNLPY